MEDEGNGEDQLKGQVIFWHRQQEIRQLVSGSPTTSDRKQGHEARAQVQALPLLDRACVEEQANVHESGKKIKHVTKSRDNFR